MSSSTPPMPPSSESNPLFSTPIFFPYVLMRPSIVAIPGLGANPAKSWMWDEKDEKSFNWLADKDGLQKDFPKARVMLYYYASAYRGAFKIKQHLTNIAKVMLDAIQLQREVGFRHPAPPPPVY